MEILAQPVILKSNACIWIGLRRGFGDQRLDCLEFVDDPRECRPLTIRIGNGKLNRQRSAKQT